MNREKNMIHQDGNFFTQVKNELQKDGKTIKRSRVDITWKNGVLCFPDNEIDDSEQGEKENYTYSSLLENTAKKMQNIALIKNGEDYQAYIKKGGSFDESDPESFYKVFPEEDFYAIKFKETDNKIKISDKIGKLSDIPFNLEDFVNAIFMEDGEEKNKKLILPLLRYNCAYFSSSSKQGDSLSLHYTENGTCRDVAISMGLNSTEAKVNPDNAIIVFGIYENAIRSLEKGFKLGSVNLDLNSQAENYSSNSLTSKPEALEFASSSDYRSYIIATTLLAVFIMSLDNGSDQCIGFIKKDNKIYFRLNSTTVFFNDFISSDSLKEEMNSVSNDVIHRIAVKSIGSEDDLTASYDAVKGFCPTQGDFEKDLFYIQSGILPSNWENYKELGLDFTVPLKTAKDDGAKFSDENLSFIGYSQEAYSKL